MVAVRVYVEGGGDSKSQMKPLRIAVKKWIESAVPGASSVNVTACGGRAKAYEDFCLALETHDDAFCILLVDSEAPVTHATRWEHVKHREGDGWARPVGSGEENLHFMAQAMEAWLCADPEALAAWFGQGFKSAKLPKHVNLEEVGKSDLKAKLRAATKPSARGEYHKGDDLALLGEISPAKVVSRCPGHAKALVETLKKKVAGG